MHRVIRFYRARTPLGPPDVGSGSLAPGVQAMFRCGHDNDPNRLFCTVCGAADREGLRTVRLMGPVGVRHSNSDTIAQFWATGDPEVFSKPTA